MDAETVALLRVALVALIEVVEGVVVYAGALFACYLLACLWSAWREAR